MNAYSLILLFSILILIFFVKKNSELSEEKFWKIFFFTFIFSVIGAKIFHLIENTELYLQNPQLISISKGYSILGAISFGYLTIIYFQKNFKLDMSKIFLNLFLMLPVAQTIGRIGNIFNQELLPYSYYEMILNMINFVILFIVSKRNPKIVQYVYFINYGILRLLIEVLKGNRFNFLEFICAFFIFYGFFNLYKLRLKI
jgi:prolipoprotein diacylglyceryltransferase